MRLRRLLPGLIVVLGLMGPLSAHGSISPGQARVRAWMGFTTLSLGDFNDQIRTRRDAFMADTLTDESRWDPMGGSPSVAAELEVRVTNLISAGLGVSAHRGAVTHEALKILSYDIDTGEPAEIESFDEKLTVSAWDVVGNVGIWVPSAPGLHFGAQVGLVRATLERQSMYLIDAFTVEPNMQFREGSWKGTGVVLGAYTGYEQTITSQLAFTSRLGYRYRNVGRLEGREIITDWGDSGNAREWEIGPFVDENGNRIGLDISGFYFKVGLAMSLGGGD